MIKPYAKKGKYCVSAGRRETRCPIMNTLYSFVTKRNCVLCGEKHTFGCSHPAQMATPSHLNSIDLLFPNQPTVDLHIHTNIVSIAIHALKEQNDTMLISTIQIFLQR